MASSECDCEPNWQHLVKEYDEYIGRCFIDKRTGQKYTFDGILHGDDDYYFVLRNKGDLVYLSCVADLFQEYEREI